MVLSLMFIAVVLSPTSASAAPTVQLTVNGGNNTAIINGQSVLLEWFIDGAVTNCSINNGVGNIDTSVLPVTGNLTVTPPDSASTNYTLTCNGGSSVVVVNVNPEITIVPNQGSPVSINPLYGEVETLDITWTSRYATQCTRVWRETASNPGVQLWTGDTNNGQRFQPNGDVRYAEYNSQDAITETATYFIQCENTITGTVSVASTTVIVDNGVIPPAPTVDIWSTDGNTIAPDSLLGWAIFDLKYIATDITECSLEAYYLDGTTYAQLPDGFDRYGRITSRSNPTLAGVKIATSTRFEVTCTQANYMFGGSFYATSTVADDVTIIVDPAIGDRSGVPAIQLIVTPFENPVTINPLTNLAQAPVRVQVQNAERCTYSASGDAAGWWGQDSYGELRDQVVIVNLPATTTLTARCYREYDLLYYATGTPEHTAGEVIVSVDINVNASSSSAPVIETYIYGNAVWLDSDYMWDNRTAMVDFVRNGGGTNEFPSLRTINGNSNIPVTEASITFPFVSPDKFSDQYDIHVKYCDENDGSNDFTITTESGYTFSWISDSTATYDSWCNKWNTSVSEFVGSGVTLQDGELITISCDNTSAATQDEPCIIIGVGFGQGDSGTITADISTSTGFATVPILWMSEHGENCRDQDATVPTGTKYQYSFSDETHDFTTNDISTTTVFSILCFRSSGETQLSSVEVLLGNSVAPIVATTSVQTGECTDPVTLLTRNALPGERANPITTLCELSVDLVALSPALSYLSAIEDNINGTYDGLDALILIQNFGEGELPAGSDIAYPAVLNFDPVYVTEFGIPAQISTPIAPGFNASLTAPVLIGGVPTPPTQSPTLTKTFDGVPFGTHELCSRINLDGTVYPEWNIDYSNNSSCTTVTLPVPQPPMVLEIDRSAIRAGQSVTLGWDLNVTYDMTCTIQGPGGINQTITAGSPATNPYTGVATTTPLTSTGTFVFTCSEPITGTVFTEEFTVEVVPESQEV